MNYVPSNNRSMPRRRFLAGCAAGAAAFVWPVRRSALLSGGGVPLPGGWCEWAARERLELAHEAQIRAGQWDALIVVAPPRDWPLQVGRWLACAHRVWLDAPPLPEARLLECLASKSLSLDRVTAGWQAVDADDVPGDRGWKQSVRTAAPNDVLFEGLCGWMARNGGEAPHIGVAGCRARWLITFEAPQRPVWAFLPGASPAQNGTAPWRPAADWFKKSKGGVPGCLLVEAAQQAHASLRPLG